MNNTNKSYTIFDGLMTVNPNKFSSNLTAFINFDRDVQWIMFISDGTFITLTYSKYGDKNTHLHSKKNGTNYHTVYMARVENARIAKSKLNKHLRKYKVPGRRCCFDISKEKLIEELNCCGINFYYPKSQ